MNPSRGLPVHLSAGLLAAAVAMLVVAGALVYLRVRLFDGRADRKKPGSRLGQQLGLAQARAAAEHTRPALSAAQRARADPAEVGVSLGRLDGRPLYATHEDTVGVIGPPRSGKTLRCAVGWVLDAPGAAVVTSTKPDLYRLTTGPRSSGSRPVVLFDPEQLVAGAAGLRWDPVRGCEQPRVALRRAAALMAGAETGSVGDASFWVGSATDALRCLLHAAALSGGTLADVARWYTAPDAEEPYEALDSPHAAPGWLATLATQLRGDVRTRSSVVRTLARGLSCLADPDVLAACCPPAGQGFDPAAFLTGAGTVYVLASDTTVGSAAPLASAFTDELVETARATAARLPAGRLDPPLTLVLDEVANGAPLPNLPNYLADAGGRGVSVLWLAQSFAQLRARWGADEASAILTATTAKLLFGGLDDADDLRAISALAGERDDRYNTSSRQVNGGNVTSSTQVRRLPVLPVERLREVEPGSALLLYRSLPAAVVTLPLWTARPDADRVGAAAVALR